MLGDKPGDLGRNPGEMYQQPRLARETREKYRTAARTKYPEAHIADTTTVHPANGGAFIEMTIWIAEEEINGVDNNDR